MPDTKSAQFIHEFEHIMSDVALPQRLTENYTVSSIFKDTDNKKIYQLCDASGNLFILKVQAESCAILFAGNTTC